MVKSAGILMDAFVVPVFYHGGRFERMANGDRCYVGGQVKKYPPMDVDFVNKEDLLVLARDLGYLEHKELFWQDPTQILFEDGGYESAEDEPYKSPPPSFESDNLKLRKNKGKNVEAKKRNKKYAGKRRNHHVLSGSGSGSGSGVGVGFGEGIRFGLGSQVGSGIGSWGGIGSGVGAGDGIGLGQNINGPNVDEMMGQNMGLAREGGVGGPNDSLEEEY
ncbi:hypothetical protein PIB30_015693 [Stylosanthes scabra]|uniref:PB1-like domain-containing protein n=1 Tax=Stylosanthes scabra TaxID=79078 RepID=A0ABU6V625_9FABA|nr:hypothetical protein [Stylosanthes scabra]